MAVLVLGALAQCQITVTHAEAAQQNILVRLITAGRPHVIPLVRNVALVGGFLNLHLNLTQMCQQSERAVVTQDRVGHVLVAHVLMLRRLLVHLMVVPVVAQSAATGYVIVGRPRMLAAIAAVQSGHAPLAAVVVMPVWHVLLVSMDPLPM